MITAQTRKEREVWHACEELYEDGIGSKGFTNELIAQKLLMLGYCRGSNTDISRFKKSWLSNKNFEPYDPNTANSISLLADPILVAAKALRTEIQSEAQGEIEKIRLTAKEKLQTFSIEVEKLKEENQKLTQERGRVQSLYETLLQENEDLKNTYLIEKQERKLIQESLKLKEAQFSEFRQMMDRQALDLKNSNDEIVTSLKDQLKIKEREHDRILSELKSQHETMRHRFIVENDTLKVALQKTAKQVETLQQTNQKQNIDNAKALEKIAHLEKTIEQELAKIHELEESILHLERNNAKLEGQGDQLNQDLSRRMLECTGLSQEKTHMLAKILELEFELKAKNKLTKSQKSKID